MGASVHHRLIADAARCDREIAEIDTAYNEESRAYLVTLGREDWIREKRLIEQELEQYGDRSPD